MDPSTPAESPYGTAQAGGTDTVSGRRLAAQSVASMVVLLAGVTWVGRHYGPALESLGRTVVQRAGLLGFLGGSFLADAVHVPVPPQFYILAVVSSHCPPVAPLAAVCLGSVLAGHVNYRVGGMLTRVGLFQRVLARSRGRVDQMFVRYGVWAVAVGAITPAPFPLLCYLSGLYRVPYRLFSVLTLLRVPRLLFFYVLLRAGLRHG